PAEEIVGDRQPLSRSYDVFDNPLQTQLPGGRLQPAGAIAGWSRGFDTLDRVTTVGPLGTGAHTSGAAWKWGGAARLFEMTTAGGRGTQARFGYHSGPGPSSSAEPAPWRLGALEWGTSGGATWGKFEAGWRQGDGAKLSRPSAGGPFAGLGWSYRYDAGVRLSSASGDLDRWGFDYGLGDERESERRDQTGELTLFGAGANGRIETRGALAFAHDLSGRRTEDDRFSYVWDWRGQLVEVTVKDIWPDADGDGELDRSPFAGHQVRYRYDAVGRLLQREHRGIQLTSGDRTLLELREYVWDGETLAAEISWASPDRTNARWRKTYVPGASGLDDSVQVLVEIGDQAGNPFANSTHLYTYLRDETGSVVGMVAEDEAPAEASKPAAPVRYLYTPYGEAHAESGPELRRAHYDNSLISAGGITQDVSNLHAAAPGAMVLDWSLGIDAASLAQGLAVEKLEAGTGWLALSPDKVIMAVESGEGELGRAVVMAVRGWEASTSYRVRIKPELRDTLGRTFGKTESFEWRVPDPPAEASAPLPTIAFDKKIPVRFENWAAAWNDVGGRFPGGQTALFQGLYTDNVTGLSYARARWYDARNASWLSEDSVLATDSPNFYAFVAWAPSMASDPLGEESIRQWWEIENDLVDRPLWGGTKWFAYQAWNMGTFGFLGEHDELFETTSGSEYAARTALAAGKAGAKLYVAVQTAGAGAAFGQAVGLGRIATGTLVGGAVGGTLTATDDLFNFAEGKPTHSLRDYATNIAAGAALGALGGTWEQVRSSGMAGPRPTAPRVNLARPRPQTPIEEIPGAVQGGRRVYKIPPGSSGGATAYEKITPAIRERYFPANEPAPLCSYCRYNPARPVDHVWARSKGGNLEPENTTPACDHCNPSKRDYTAPKNPPPGYQGQWPPPWWPTGMRNWWMRTHGGR
ncbi:MAG TPA: RHS repeat-associated core domain-containing protein, partial [Gemmatimonadales bacterium]|nr:RHS repeat-associated core domain-containing protein [Gemmatimonadales bacterium]